MNILIGVLSLCTALAAPVTFASPTYAELESEFNNGSVPEREMLVGYWLAECSYNPEIFNRRLGGVVPGQREPFGAIIGGAMIGGALVILPYVSFKHESMGPTYTDKNVEETKQMFLWERQKFQQYYEAKFSFVVPAYESSRHLTSLFYDFYEGGMPRISHVFNVTKNALGSLVLALSKISRVEESTKDGTFMGSREFFCRSVERLE